MNSCSWKRPTTVSSKRRIVSIDSSVRVSGIRSLLRAVGSTAPAQQVCRLEQLGLVSELAGEPRELDVAALHDVGAIREPERHGGELLDQQHPDARIGYVADRGDQALHDDRREAQRQLV